MPPSLRLASLTCAALAALALTSCRTTPVAPPPTVPNPTPARTPASVAIVTPLPLVPANLRKGDEIIVAGQAFHTGTRVVTWVDRGGYNGYSTELKPLPVAPAPSARGKVPIAKPIGITFGVRTEGKSPALPGSGQPDNWSLAKLQQHVDQFVLHYDVAGFSRECFDVLHYQRGLSVHFMLDLDGTIYQTLDLKEAAYHATTSNNRSIGIEIANIGAYAPNERKTLSEWYVRGAFGRVHIVIPDKYGSPEFRRWHFTARPDRPEPIRGVIQDKELYQYDFTPEQYAALIKLTAALCRVFPRITCDYPHDAKGQVLTHKLPDNVLANYHGVLGHFHIQTNKIDPGPAMQWDKVISGARALLP